MESIKAEYYHALDIVSQAKGGQWLSERSRHILGYDSVVLSHDKDAPFNGVTAWGVQVGLNKQMFCSSSSLCAGLPLLPLCSSALRPQPHTIGAHSRDVWSSLGDSRRVQTRSMSKSAEGVGSTRLARARAWGMQGAFSSSAHQVLVAACGCSRGGTWDQGPWQEQTHRHWEQTYGHQSRKRGTNEDCGINRTHTT